MLQILEGGALGLDEVGHERRRGIVEEYRHRSLLDNFALVEEDDVVAKETGFPDVVRDEDDGLAESAEDCTEVVLKVSSNHGVEGSQWFVEQ